ncbi:hypothetical protein NIES4071_102220 (plasmid) [Calothrix sp. NIES-4071]|nr:hypothetical protein NIES4071_102220 [Calothrix sp. NIES-4071]BAZ64603.1 hypothetical protein NIES4105_103360 [Calothrix sp. NIES-4105]
MDTAQKFDSNQVALVRESLKELLAPEDKAFYLDSIADSGINEENVDKLKTGDIDNLLLYLNSIEATPEYYAKVFAAIESHLPDYLVSHFANSDKDNDGVTLAEELRLGTNPSVADNHYRSYAIQRSQQIDNGIDL